MFEKARRVNNLPKCLMKDTDSQFISASEGKKRAVRRRTQ